MAFQVEVREFWEKARTFTIIEPNKSLKRERVLTVGDALDSG